MTEYDRCKKSFEKFRFVPCDVAVAKGETKTTINLDSDVYEASKSRAKRLGVDFGELVELSLKRDLSEKMAILRSDEGLVYAPIVEPKEDDPVEELISWLKDSETRFRDQRWYGALFRVSVAQDIAQDIRRWRDELIAKRDAALSRNRDQAPYGTPAPGHLGPKTHEDKKRREAS